MEPNENIRSPGIDDAVERLLSGRISRMQFIRRATALGVSAGGIGAFLAACGGGDDAAVPAPGATVGEKPFAGSTVNVLLVSGEGDDLGLRDKIGEIKDRFGIDVVVTDLEIGAMHDKILATLRSGTSSYDIIDVLGFWVTEMVGADYFEPLGPYVEDSSKTPSDYDFGDFPAGQLEYVGYYDVAKRSFGGDTLYLIPGIHAGSALVFYRKDLFDQAGLAPPGTWDDYLAAAEKLHDPGNGVFGNSFIGRVDPSLFLVDWYTRLITIGGELMSGSPAEKNYTPNLDSAEAIAALENLVACKEFAPPGVLEYGFTESVDAMAAGKVGMMLMWSTIAGSMYDPAKSKVADKIDVATMPGDGGDAGQAVRGGWGLGIPKNSKNKDAAWQVMTYITGKEFEQYQVANYRTDPNRLSTFDALAGEMPYLPAAKEATEKAKILDIASVPETFQLIDLANRHFNSALNGSESIEDACKKANAEWIDVLKRGGHLA